MNPRGVVNTITSRCGLCFNIISSKSHYHQIEEWEALAALKNSLSKLA